MGGGEMTPEKQRVVIAEACGWQRCNVNSDNEFYGVNPNGIYTILPNYPFDLNAMHEAEKVLWDTGKAMEFTNQLVGIACSARGFRWDKGTSDDHLMCLSHARADERAEAFLRTIGKWEEA
jgi:hypothetical protein